MSKSISWVNGYAHLAQVEGAEVREPRPLVVEGGPKNLERGKDRSCDKCGRRKKRSQRCNKTTHWAIVILWRDRIVRYRTGTSAISTERHQKQCNSPVMR